MGRRREHIVGIAAACALGIAGGCTGENADATLIIVHNKAPEEGCTVPVEEEAVFRSRGFIDVRNESGYLFTPLARNFATTPSNYEGQSASRRIIFVEGAEVRLDIQSQLVPAATISSLSAANLLAFSQPFSATLNPDSFASMAFEIIPLDVLIALRDALPDDGAKVPVQATIQLYGTLAGEEVKSQEYVYWIDMCDGCGTVNLGDCTLLEPGFTPKKGGICSKYQDGFEECCTEGSMLTCPAEPSSSM
jgi:hypothetical protein